MLGQIDGVRFEGSDSFLPVQCSGTKAIQSFLAWRRAAWVRGTSSAFVRVAVCEYRILFHLVQVYLVT